ncbi:GINS complex protein [Popillia japonica]|uniref:DNA replication complex GINS protein PSF3 n=1 Tax=Popillia japonica TaxID=7064 RepID=A0AAW1IFH7_POPJA
MYLQSSYMPNYFAIDDILATQERTPCKFVVNVPALGIKLNPSAEGDDIQIGTTLELPMWLIQQLARGRQPVVAVDLPQMYQEAYREVLKADPRAVNLHKFGLYFYELGSYAKEFDNKREVGDILIHNSTLTSKYLQ